MGYTEWKTDLGIVATVATAVGMAALVWSGGHGPLDTPAPAAPVVVEEQGTPPADIQQAPAAPFKADDFMGAVALCDYYYVADTAAWTDCVLAADDAFPVEDIETLDS